MQKSIQDCVIIGSGPAGYTAAIYAARANLKPILIQGMQPGGQLTITTEVENYPGFPDPILGPALMEQFEAQARNVGAEIVFGTVTEVELSTRPFTVHIDGEKILQTRGLIVATGASAKWLGLESEARLNGKGVSACAVCDGFFFRGKEVAIVGGGDTACEEALYLSKICTKVHMIVRNTQLRASKAMQKKLFDTKNIQVYFSTTTQEILGQDAVESVRLHDGAADRVFTLPIQGFFVAIGHTPNSSLFRGMLDMDDAGYIRTQPGSSKTNIPGVFAAGDIQDKIYRQAITSAGSGCMAALDLERFLQHEAL